MHTPATKAGRDLVNWHDLAFNYSIFVVFEVKGGVRTLCAMAETPYDMLQSQINTLKLILATSRRPLN